jgi:transketolase
MVQQSNQAIISSLRAGEGHIPSAFSILDILWVLYDKVLTSDDIFVLSKGHGSLALYAILAAKGIIPQEELLTFAKHDSILGGHPDRNKIPGVVASTGSLGHGFPMAVGMALGKKIKNESGTIYCLIGDGECNEGSIWEASLLAVHHKLNNLCGIVDHNHSTDRALNLESLPAKFESFGFSTDHIIGHNHFDLENSLHHRCEKPSMIVAETTKGYGCRRMENNPEWHHKAPSKTELDEILAEL